MSISSYIIGAKRSPLAPRYGALASLSIDQLSKSVIHSLLTSCGLEPNQVDELIVGNALGAGGNPARLIALSSGLSEHVAGISIDTQCSSGLDAILLANDMIASGRASIVIAGGAESYSMRPRRLRKTENHRKDNNEHWEEYDQPAFTPWPSKDPAMSAAANALAEKLNISFDDQNAWAIDSHQKALYAREHLQSEIVPINNVEIDTYTRNVSMAVCTRAKRINGSISIANTSTAADGAAFCVVVSEAIASTIPSSTLRLRSGYTVGANPELPGLAPVNAIAKVLNHERLEPTDLNRAEIMEAFAAQAIACIEQAGINKSICNVSGGSLSRGHPIGASGAVLMTRLFTELKQTGGVGLAAIAAAGGLGTAVLVEHVT